MAVERRCEHCGRAFTGRDSRSRFCSSKCRSEAHRGKTVVALPNPEARAKSTLTAALESELATVERVDTPLGQAALAVAARITSGVESGNAVAALSRELRALRAEVLADVAPKGSRVEGLRDELAERRRA